MSLVEELRIQYSDFLIDIKNWEILDNGVTVLWGPSGSGKTSVLRGLLGLESEATCCWILNNIDIGKLPVTKREIGVVFQNYELFPHMTAMQNIKFAADCRRVTSLEFEKILNTLAKKLKIEKHLQKFPYQLSGGEKQRVSLIQAIIGRPRIVFLDEPFSALDEELRQESRELVKEVLFEFKIPALLITHDKRDVDFLANKVSVIKNGKI